LGGFFFYVFIVHPCTAWILRPGRFERRKSILYAIAFLAALAAVKTGTCAKRSARMCRRKRSLLRPSRATPPRSTSSPATRTRPPVVVGSTCRLMSLSVDRARGTFAAGASARVATR
jgi:hypothetical protein